MNSLRVLAYLLVVCFVQVVTGLPTPSSSCPFAPKLSAPKPKTPSPPTFPHHFKRDVSETNTPSSPNFEYFSPDYIKYHHEDSFTFDDDGNLVVPDNKTSTISTTDIYAVYS